MQDTVIWDRVREARKGPRPAHTLDDIARAAISVGDANGVEAVSIRAVAAQLGAGAASLYRYISRKDDLYDLMVDSVAAEYELPSVPSGEWEADVVLVARRIRDVYRRHPWMAELAPHASWGPNTQDYMEFFLAALEPTGLGHVERIEFIGLMSAWIATFTQLVQQPAATGAGRLRHFASIAADPARPQLAQAIVALMRADPSSSSPDQLFERGLHRLIHGIAG
ncbi:TetR/AcrR family transcriptional regulator C-terminal domain-containing protein [Microbacterium sp. BWT-B31]|uniref:TetR/AcrR family transcriptional regulator n=1 Tax=Microbacterium sp. BWT-B31 TaxID=3232072 RepID=UPI0035279017